MVNLERRIGAAKYVLSMLERLSADSTWAHQASGLRGSILRAIEQLEAEPNPESRAPAIEILDRRVDQGYQILELAAQEIPEGNERKKNRGS